MKKLTKKVFLSCILIYSLSALNASPFTARQYYEMGQEADLSEDWPSAVQHYLEAVQENPSYTDAWFSLARDSYLLGEPDLALQYLENAERIEKNNSRIMNLKGMILLSLGRNVEAKSIFDSILSKYPNDVEAHFGLAELLLYDGKTTGAKGEYEKALRRQGNNKKALMSLALLNAFTGDFDKADDCLRRVYNYYSSDASVHTLGAMIACMKNDLRTAETQSRIAVELNGNYDEAYHLLGQILYYQGRYEDVIDLCDFQISRNRNDSGNWYLKGLAQKKAGDNLGAIDTWSVGLNINPTDEIMRMMLELEVRDNISLEDSRRKDWAQYHINIAKQNDERYDGVGSSFEYQRALRIDPMNEIARLAYANMLELNGMHELYLEQLKFIKDFASESKLHSKKGQELDDLIEAYDSLLTETLAKKWDVQPFFLDKIRWNIGIFYENRAMNFIHADSDRLAAMAASDIFSGVASTSVNTVTSPVSGFGEAFKISRNLGYDYFVILSLDEGNDDVTLSATMYSARTGSITEKFMFYATGNQRFSTVLRRFRQGVLENLPVRGKIINRRSKTVLLDLGKTEHITNDAVFQIVKAGRLTTADTGTGLYFREDDVLGTVRVTNCGEEISEGLIESKGFYDRINSGDEVVLVSLPSQNSSGKEDVNTAIDNAPVADAKGKVVVHQNTEAESPLSNEIKKAVNRPVVLEMIQKLY